MLKARHPDSDRKITVPQHKADFGNDFLNQYELARCPVCNQRLKAIAASSTGAVAHFAHQRGSLFCPSKIEHEGPYRGLTPRNPDLEAARRIRQLFRENWAKHFEELNWLVKGLAVDEFTNAILIANQERIWEYAQLQEYQLPYVFATLLDFPPHRSYIDKKTNKPKRTCWFRCWFDSSVQRYDDLWIHRTTPLQFWRGWYNVPKGKRKPRIENLEDCYPMELSDDFLTRESSPPAYVVTKISTWLDRHFQID